MTNQGANLENWSLAADDALRARQLAGIADLIRISVQTSSQKPNTPVAPPAAPEAWLLRSRSGVEEKSPQIFDGFSAPESGKATLKERLRLVATSLRTDDLMRNSLYLMLSSVIQAALGFTFWIIMARIYSTEDVGRASSLIAATSLITYFSLFGLNSTLVRFLPTADRKHSLVTVSLTLVGCAGAVIGLAYILLTPVFAPPLAFIEHRPTLVLGFVLLTSAAAINQLTDSVFIATRKAHLCALSDAVIGGTSKIIFGIFLVGAGSYGLYSASVGGMAAAALASVFLIIITFGWRPSFKRTFRTIRPLLKFSGANYVANAVELLPTLVVPLIVLDRLGAPAVAYYSVAFQMAGLLYVAVYAVESAFMAEGAQAKADWRAIRARSRRLAIRVFVPGGVLLALIAHWILLAFGSNYSHYGTASLQLLAVSVIPLAACNWSWGVLRLTDRLVGLLVSNAAYSIAICSFAWFLASHGLTALTAAWPLGTTVAAVVSAFFVARVSRGKHSASALGVQRVIVGVPVPGDGSMRKPPRDRGASGRHAAPSSDRGEPAAIRM